MYCQAQTFISFKHTFYEIRQQNAALIGFTSLISQSDDVPHLTRDLRDPGDLSPCPCSCQISRQSKMDQIVQESNISICLNVDDVL